MALTPITKSRVPTTTDAPNGPQQIAAAVGDLETFSVMRFDSSPDRNARMVGIVPKDGMMCYLTDSQSWQVFRSTWVTVPWVPEFQDGSLLGIAWDSTTRIIDRAGSRVVTTGASGAISFGWGAFPHGIMAMNVSVGDYIPDAGARANGTALNVLPILANMSARDTFNGIALATNNAPVVAGVNVRVSYEVWGW